MAKTRADFIADLLKRKETNPLQKERIFILAAKELESFINGDSRLIKENEELRRTIASNNDTIKETTIAFEADDEKAIKTKHKPKDVADFMSLFNKRDGLKYLTHDYDEDGFFDIDGFLKSASKVFNTNTHYKFSIPKRLWSVINEFAFINSPTWYLSKYRPLNEGWSTDEWKTWSKSNSLHPIRNQKFKEIISVFREVTRIESPYFEKFVREILEDVFEVELGSFQFEFNALDKADFYTHTPSLKNALHSILSLMKSRAENNKISLNYVRATDGDYFVRKLIIAQHGSFPSKEIDVLINEWKSDKGAMGGIRSNLYGYCNWSVETRIDGEAVRINILKDDHAPDKQTIPNAEVMGFKHILTFYYK